MSQERNQGQQLCICSHRCPHWPAAISHRRCDSSKPACWRFLIPLCGHSQGWQYVTLKSNIFPSFSAYHKETGNFHNLMKRPLIFNLISNESIQIWLLSFHSSSLYSSFWYQKEQEHLFTSIQSYITSLCTFLNDQKNSCMKEET